MKKQEKKVLIGMSGGIDSSVSAYILQKKGYLVEGVFVKTCGNDPLKAQEIAKLLKITLHIVDVEKEFDKHVIQYYINTYKEGRTPNPCAICNRYIKFQSLIDKAEELGIKYIATGHYVNIGRNIFNGRYILKKAKDTKKDQSYILFNLTQYQLSKCLFPLGKYKKTEVRNIAQKLGLNIPKEEESQDICFTTNIQTKPGDIVNNEGKLLGKHKGITNYTIGQRKGIEISSPKPLYVVDIDANKNRIIVGEKEKLYKNELFASDINWVSIQGIKKDISAEVKIRYGAKPEKAKIIPFNDEKVRIIFKEQQRAITPGQAVVFYKGKIILGGGIIV